MRTRSKPKFIFGSEQIRQYVLDAARNPESLSLSSTLTFGVFIFAVGFLFSSGDIEGISYHVLDFSVLLSTALVYFLCRQLTKFIHGYQLAINICTWVLVGWAGVFSPTLVVWLLTGTANEQLITQSPPGLIAYPVLIIIFSVGIAVVRTSSKNMKELKLERLALRARQENLVRDIELLRGEIRGSVEQELSKAISVISDPSKKPKQISNKLLKAIDNVIRPLSHKLADESGEDAIPPTKVEEIQKPKLPLGRVSLSSLIAPLEYFVGSIVFVLPASYYLEGLEALGFAILLSFTISWVYYLMRTFTAGLYISRPVAIILIAMPAALIGSLFHIVYKSQDALGISAGFVLFAVVIAITLALISRRIQIMEHLSFINQEAQTLVAQLRQESWVLRTQFAKAIHGQVQAKFLAVALRLASKQDLSIEDFESAKSELQASMASVEDSLSGQGQSFLEQMRLLSDSWEQVVAIELEARQEDTETVDRFPIARTCLVEVVSEAVSNAAKHSRSPKLTVKFSISDRNSLELLVISDGRLSRIDNSRTGYGSRLLNEVTSAWFLSSVKGKVYLTASIKLLA